MRTFFISLSLAILAYTGTALSISKGELPTETDWYLHVDLTQMRSTVTGQHLMVWMSDEVFDEIEGDTGVDLEKNLDGITVFGNGDEENDAALLLHGNLSGSLQADIVAFLESETDTLVKESMGYIEVYSFEDLHLKDRKRRHRRKSKNDDVDITVTADDGAFIAFGKKGQTLITQNRSLLETWSDAGGQLSNRSSNHSGALLVLEADRSLIQGGVKRDIGHRGPWNSSIGKNMEQIALILFDEAGLAALDVNILTSTPKTAESLHDVVKGLLSLKSLTLDDEPEISELLDDTDVNLSGQTVTISARFDPETLVSIFD
ncbi:MAG: hypothetical protein AAF438_01620 [Pseudomonadota bacterium]